MATKRPHFAVQLIKFRERTGVSKYLLAQRAGMSRQALSLLELGEREPTWLTVQRLAAALGVSCDEFVDPQVSAALDLEVTKPAKPRRPRSEEEPQAEKAKGQGKSRSRK
jgi:transcriptional regulator with XRE-family HTH domain